MGFQGMLLAFHKQSEKIHDLLHGVERLNIGLAKRAVDVGADGVLIADDIAYNRSTTAAPRDRRRSYFPSLERQVAGIAGLGIPVFFHSDGNLNPVMDDLVGTGFQGLQCLESGAGMDLANLKASYGRRVCLWGNLDPKHLFLERRSRELGETVQKILEVGTPGGGFIFGTSSGLVDGMRLENIEAVYRVVGGGGSCPTS
jgi:uroporphyrinogen decarboxylase